MHTISNDRYKLQDSSLQIENNVIIDLPSIWFKPVWVYFSGEHKKKNVGKQTVAIVLDSMEKKYYGSQWLPATVW